MLPLSPAPPLPPASRQRGTTRTMRTDRICVTRHGGASVDGSGEKEGETARREGGHSVFFSCAGAADAAAAAARAPSRSPVSPLFSRLAPNKNDDKRQCCSWRSWPSRPPWARTTRRTRRRRRKRRTKRRRPRRSEFLFYGFCSLARLASSPPQTTTGRVSPPETPPATPTNARGPSPLETPPANNKQLQ